MEEAGEKAPYEGSGERRPSEQNGDILPPEVALKRELRPRHLYVHTLGSRPPSASTTR